jgi:hypothetical protein
MWTASHGNLPAEVLWTLLIYSEELFWGAAGNLMQKSWGSLPGDVNVHGCACIGCGWRQGETWNRELSIKDSFAATATINRHKLPSPGKFQSIWEFIEIAFEALKFNALFWKVKSIWCIYNQTHCGARTSISFLPHASRFLGIIFLPRALTKATCPTQQFPTAATLRKIFRNMHLTYAQKAFLPMLLFECRYIRLLREPVLQQFII